MTIFSRNTRSASARRGPARCAPAATAFSVVAFVAAAFSAAPVVADQCTIKTSSAATSCVIEIGRTSGKKHKINKTEGCAFVPLSQTASGQPGNRAIVLYSIKVSADIGRPIGSFTLLRDAWARKTLNRGRAPDNQLRAFQVMTAAAEPGTAIYRATFPAHETNVTAGRIFRAADQAAASPTRVATIPYTLNFQPVFGSDACLPAQQTIQIVVKHLQP